jgi:hypothetical protein
MTFDLVIVMICTPSSILPSNMALLRPYDNGTRVQALTMLQLNRPVSEITHTGYNKRTISRIQKKAKEREYKLEKDPKIPLAYVEDTPRASRPKRATPEVEQEVIKTISKNSTTRGLSTTQIAEIVSPLTKGGKISARTIH